MAFTTWPVRNDDNYHGVVTKATRRGNNRVMANPSRNLTARLVTATLPDMFNLCF